MPGGKAPEIRPKRSSQVHGWLSQDASAASVRLGFRRSYSVKGVPGFKFVPMWEIPPSASFTTYPLFTA